MVKNMESNIEFDSYIINDGKSDKTIYPLIEFENENKKYIIYVETLDFKSMDDLFVGELVDNGIIPVDSDDMSKFENIVAKMYNEIKK